MFTIYDESEAPNDQHVSEMRGVLRMYDGPGSRNEGVCVRYMTNRNRHMSAVLKIYDDTESPNEGVCLRYMMSRNRQVSGRV